MSQLNVGKDRELCVFQLQTLFCHGRLKMAVFRVLSNSKSGFLGGRAKKGGGDQFPRENLLVLKTGGLFYVNNWFRLIS